MSTDEQQHRPASPTHTSIEEIASDTFMVRSKHKFNALMSMNRVMTIIRHNGELTLVNPIRLTESGEAELKQLGDVKRIIRLGFFHGCDDAYYKETFKAELWATGTSTVYPKPDIDKTITEEDDLPFPDSALFVFKGAKVSEAALLIRKSDGGILVTCDALQHYGAGKDGLLYVNFLMKMAMKAMGFLSTPTVIGPPWITSATPKGESLQSEFERLLAMGDFSKHVAAHGTVCKENAKEEVKVATDNFYKKK